MIEIIEYLIIAIIVAFQFLLFWKAKKWSAVLIDLYPAISSQYRLKKVQVYIADNVYHVWNPLESAHLREINEYVRDLNNKPDSEDIQAFHSLVCEQFGDFSLDRISKEIDIAFRLRKNLKVAFKEVDIIDVDYNWNEDFKQIVLETNDYLINNKGNAIDFNIIKGISERKNNEIENNIHSIVGVPLYLGLIGTMIGIVLGVMLINDTNINNGIELLLSGVKIAMFASIFGLFLTTLNNAYYFKNAKNERDKEQNHYYNFIQKYLLPLVSAEITHSVTAKLTEISGKLNEFNEGFRQNNEQFNEALHRVKGVLFQSIDFVDKLKRIDKEIKSIELMYSKVAESSEKFAIFADYQDGLNLVLQNSSKSIEQTSKVFEKVNAFENTLSETFSNVNNLFGEVKDNVSKANKLFNFLNTHYNSFQDIGDTTKILISGHGDSLRNMFQDHQEIMKDLSNNHTVALEKINMKIENQVQQIPQLAIDEIKDSITGSVEKAKERIDSVYSEERVQQFSESIVSELKKMSDGMVQMQTEIKGIKGSLEKKESNGDDRIVHLLTEIKDNLKNKNVGNGPNRPKDPEGSKKPDRPRGFWNNLFPRSTNNHNN